VAQGEGGLEEEEETMNLEHLHQFTARLAGALTGLGLEGTWKATAYHTFCWVALADRLNLRHEPGRGGRLVLRPEYPRDGRGTRHTGGGPEEATYAPGRSPDDVARDLGRRLRLSYLKALGRALEEVRDADRRAREAQALLEELAHLSGTRSGPRPPGRLRVTTACGAVLHVLVGPQGTVLLGL
jgi:hypothetical protein